MAESTSQATVLISGGIDSAACVHLFKSRGLLVEGLFVDYGQAALGAESRAVTNLAEHLSIPLRLIQVGADDCRSAGELVGRNALLISTALFVTRGRRGVIGIGVHAGTPYFDCSEAFIQLMDRLVGEQTDGQVSVVAPFLTWQKSDIYDYFRAANLPVMLTYSCEVGSDPPCGSCASCEDRRAMGC